MAFSEGQYVIKVWEMKILPLIPTHKENAYVQISLSTFYFSLKPAPKISFQ